MSTTPITRLILKEFDRSFYYKVEEELEKKGFKNVGCGSFRTTFQRGKIVVKVPRHWDGFDDNIGEAHAYRKYRNNPKPEDGIVFAPCRLLPNGCLMMVYVEYVDHEELPDWGQKLDGSQAGEYKGRIVAFDSGCDLGFDKGEALALMGLPPTD